MNTVAFADGQTWPALGAGTWRMGESAASRAAEVAALRDAIDMGWRVFDTAEMYGEGGAETVLGMALAQALREGSVRRDELFVVSKVYPHNASLAGTARACDRSRKRLGLDRIDLYLLHWRGEHPLADTVAAFEALQARGAVGRWGVSNFDLADMHDLLAAGGAGCAANQVYYSAGQRGVEWDLLPWQRARAMPLMAYCPLDQGRLAKDATLAAIGRRRAASATQVALAWLLAQAGVLAIPKAGSLAHLRENLSAAALQLEAKDLQEIDAAFTPPRSKQPLAIS